jgi:hypothetical protein
VVDFRYHLVSIIAVFLALALGIVVGTTALNGAILEDLQRNVRVLTSDKRDLEGTVNDLRGQEASDQQLLDLAARSIVDEQLQGQRVVVLSAPGSDGPGREELLPLLEEAGATVVGTVELRSELFDPDRAAELDALVTRNRPSGLPVEGAQPVDRVASELALALVRRTGAEEVPTATASAVLDAFQEADLLDTEGAPATGASLALLLVGSPVQGEDEAEATYRTSALLSLARALDDRGAGAVVAGPLAAAEDDGVLQALRADNGLSDEVSSVDGVEQPRGRLAAVLALREQLRGDSGRYGTGPGGQGPARSLPPP